MLLRTEYGRLMYGIVAEVVGRRLGLVSFDKVKLRIHVVHGSMGPASMAPCSQVIGGK